MALAAKVVETLAVTEYEFVISTRGCEPWMETGVNRTATRTAVKRNSWKAGPRGLVDPGPDG